MGGIDPRITTPKPFVRDLCGKGNRLKLPFDAEKRLILLDKFYRDQWESELTAGMFCVAVRSIARERAKSIQADVMVVAAWDQQRLYTAKYVRKTP